jgi:hypothetical protein
LDPCPFRHHSSLQEEKSPSLWALLPSKFFQYYCSIPWTYFGDRAIGAYGNHKANYVKIFFSNFRHYN